MLNVVMLSIVILRKISGENIINLSGGAATRGIATRTIMTVSLTTLSIPIRVDTIWIT